MQGDQNVLNRKCCAAEKSGTCEAVAMKFHTNTDDCFAAVLTKHFCPLFAKSSDIFP